MNGSPPASNSARRQVTGLLVSRVVSSLAQAFLLLVLARSSGPETVGLCGTLTAIANLVGLADIGLQTLACRMYSRPGERSDALKAIRFANIGFSVYSSLLFLIIVTLAVTDHVPYWALLAPVWACADRVLTGEIGLRIAEGRVLQQAVPTIASRLISVGIIIVLTLAKQPPAYSYWFALLGGSVTSLLAVRVLDNSRSHYAAPSTSIRLLLPAAAPFWVTSLANSVRAQDVPTVAAFANSYQSGLYALPIRLSGPLNMAMDSLSAAAIPYVRRGDAAASALLTRYALAVSGASAMFGAAFMLWTPQLTSFALGPQYLPGVPTIRLVVLAQVIGVPEAYLTRYLQAHDLEGPVARAHTLLAILTLPVVALGARADGAHGAAFGVLGIAVLELLLLLSIARRESVPIWV